MSSILMSTLGGTICENCSDLDLRGIFAGKFEMEDGSISRESDTSVRWVWKQTKDCQFCNFIEKCSVYRTVVYDPPELDAQLEPRWLKREQSRWFELGREELILRLVFDTSPSEESWLDHSRPSTSLPHSLIGCTMSDRHDSEVGRSCPIRLIPRRIESFDVLRKRIEICQESHSCMQHTEGQEPPISIPNLLLIDCITCKVVAAPHRCWYLALSYVWGSQKARAVHTREKLSSLPQTIEDAITVTLKLGFQYLWVDMYCIKQDNQNHVGDQIRHMDFVYRRARATIIAAAGEEPDFGLPGVSSVRQTRQAYATVNGVSVANFTHDPWEPVYSSAWNSRAWTFQESLFSQCRIFFTTEQTIYNCASGWNCEGIEPTQPLTLQGANRNLNSMVRHAPPTFSDQYSNSMIYILIGQYSRRQLTFSMDILNAFSGVLHAYENLTSPVRHFWGIPITPHESSVLESFSIGLSWEFSDTATFSHQASLPRREIFPSWSWTGWEHPVSYRYEHITRKEYLPPPDLKVAIKITDGPHMLWLGLEHAIMKDQLHLSKTKSLRLEAWTTQVVLHCPAEETSTPFKRAYAIIGPEGNSYKFHAQIPIAQNSVELEPMEKYDDTYLCTGILLGGFRPKGWSLEITHPLLLVTKRGSFWERIGITYLREVAEVYPLGRPQRRDLDRFRTRDTLEEWMKEHLQLNREVMYLE